MHVDTQQQIAAIHAMMSSGQRSVRLERHTLVLWGITIALLILFVKQLVTPELLPVKWQRVAVVNSIVAVVLFVVGLWDYRMTRQARNERDETLSYIQLQITKVWWLIILLVVVLNMGMNLFGGGYLFYNIVLALTGLALFIQGLFSLQMLSWLGGLMIALALGSVALRVPYSAIEWLTIVCFGLGLPTLGILIQYPTLQTTYLRRITVSAVWLMAIVGMTTLVYGQVQTTRAPQLPVLSLEQYASPEHDSSKPVIVQLPKDLYIPVQIEVTGNVLTGTATASLPLILSNNIELVVQDEQPTGLFRIGDEPWRDKRYAYRVRDVKVTPRLDQHTGPEISVSLQINTGNELK